MAHLPSRIAIQPDRIVHKNGEVQAFSERWTELASDAGIEVRQSDAFSTSFFDELTGCNAFMWRFDYAARSRLFAKRLLSAVEHGLGLFVFPSWKTMWHFEDKIAQHYLLQAAGIPEPRTWEFWTRVAAKDFCAGATYPLVMKLSFGFQSANVRLLKSSDEAMYWIDEMFTHGVTSISRSRAHSSVDRIVSGRRFCSSCSSRQASSQALR